MCMIDTGSRNERLWAGLSGISYVSTQSWHDLGKKVMIVIHSGASVT